VSSAATAELVTFPSTGLRQLCCEGSCSPARHEIAEVYGIDGRRMIESATLVHTPHYFVRSYWQEGTRRLVWACAKCGTERLYGAEE